MNHRYRPNGALLIGLLAAACAVVAPPLSGQIAAPIEQLLGRVERRLMEFYARAQSVICVEISVVQPIGYNYSTEGFARTVESELRIQPEEDNNLDGPKVMRLVRKVNGRLPREKDKKERSGCTDPEPLSIDALAFLLPANRGTYRFTDAGTTYDRGRYAVIIDFETINRRSKAELIEDKGGHDDCFDWSGHVATQGRIWVDANNYDVLRVDRHLRGPVDVNVPVTIQRKHHFGTFVTLSREDVTTRYRTVTLNDPQEVFLLPESIESVVMVQGGLQSTRRSQTYSDYKRFTTDGRVVE